MGNGPNATGRALALPRRGFRFWCIVRSWTWAGASSHASESPTLAPTRVPAKISMTTTVAHPPRVDAETAASKSRSSATQSETSDKRNRARTRSQMSCATEAALIMPPAPSATTSKVRSPATSTRSRSSLRPQLATCVASAVMVSWVLLADANWTRSEREVRTLAHDVEVDDGISDLVLPWRLNDRRPDLVPEKVPGGELKLR